MTTNYLEVQGCKHCGHRPASEKHLCDPQSTTTEQLKEIALEVWAEQDIYAAFDYLIQTVRQHERERMREEIEELAAIPNFYGMVSKEAALSVVTPKA